MKKVKITNIDGYNYTLEENNNKYIKNIEFYDVKLNIGDYIYISDDVLKETNIYTYGPITENAREEDIIKILSNDKEIYLERYYG